jgi:hypothetical protein
MLINKKVLFNGIMGTVILMFFVASLMTIIWQGEIFDVGGNILRILTAITCFHVGYFGNFDQTLFKRRLIRWGFLGISVALIISYIAVFTGNTVYLGLSTEHLFPYISNSLAQNNLFGSLGGFFMVVMGGKRGVMLAALVMIIFVTFLYKRGLSKKKMLPFFVLIFFAASFLTFIDIHDLPTPVYNRIKPFVEGNTSDSHTQYRDATSGRSEEVFFVMNDINKNIEIAFVGKGLGATFADDSGSEDSTVHISPVALTFLFGLPLTIVFYFLMFQQFYRFLKAINKYSLPELSFWTILSLGLFINSFFVFEVLQNPLLWLSFGIAYRQYLLKQVRNTTINTQSSVD